MSLQFGLELGQMAHSHCTSSTPNHPLQGNQTSPQSAVAKSTCLNCFSTQIDIQTNQKRLQLIKAQNKEVEYNANKHGRGSNPGLHPYS